jgi:hypothetical protein
VVTIAAGVATDGAGNGNTASTSTDNSVTFGSSPPTVTRVEDTSTAITYTHMGTPWIEGNRDRPWSGGTAALGALAGQRATLSFSGTGVSWIGFRGPQTGIADVRLDGTLVATVDAYAPTETVEAVLYTVTDLGSGPHTLEIEPTGERNPASDPGGYVVVDAFDVSGSGTPPPEIVPSPDTTAPTVMITSPASGATVSGTTPVTASASDNVGVAGVQFFVDGIATGAEDTTSPYSAAWDTTTATTGSHTLTAVARDAAGNTATSAPVTVTVSTPPPATTATRIEHTDLSITYTDGTKPELGPVRWWQGSRSRGWSGGTAAFNRAAGAQATFTFIGTAVSWIGFRAHWAGIARVYVDGVFVAEIDLFEPPDPTDRENGEKDQAVVYRATGLALGTHTITVESTGQKHGTPGCNPTADPANCASDNAVVVDAFDVEPAGPPPATGTRAEESSQTTGTWGPAPTSQTRIWSGGAATAASRTACTATTPCTMTYTFTGTEVRWVGLRGPQTGIARVSLDGAFHAEVDTYSPTEIQAVVFTATNLAPANHTLVIEVTGGRNAAATDSLIVVDAFDVRRRLEETDGSVSYSGVWTKDNADKSWSGTTLNTGSGTVAYSATAGAQAQFTFTGTSVTWIGYRGPLGGIAEVWVDGQSAGEVDLYSATEQLRAPVFTRSNLVAGPHTLRIDATGRRNPGAQAALVIVDAFDVMLPSAVPTFTRLQETDPSIIYTVTSTTDWTQESRTRLRSGESARIAVPRAKPDPNFSSGQAVATVTFTGTGIRWIGDRGRSRGIARVILDGGTPIDIDTFAFLQDEYQAVIFTATNLAPGNHTLTIVVTGTKNSESQGTFIAVDAFELSR